MCFCSWNTQRIWFIHVSDDTIVACRGTEFKVYRPTVYSLDMLTFHSKSAFSIIQNYSNVRIHFFHTIASVDIPDGWATRSISIYTSCNVNFFRTCHAAYKNPFFEWLHWTDTGHFPLKVLFFWYFFVACFMFSMTASCKSPKQIMATANNSLPPLTKNTGFVFWFRQPAPATWNYEHSCACYALSIKEKRRPNSTHVLCFTYQTASYPPLRAKISRRLKTSQRWPCSCIRHKKWFADLIQIQSHLCHMRAAMNPALVSGNV